MWLLWAALAVSQAIAATPATCISALDGNTLDLSAGRWVDDDFCDCIDGSDEPTTSACSHISTAMFHCHNQGLVSTDIHASRVHDGICDCCDGSDEPEGVCRDMCQAEIEERRRRARETLATVQAGVNERQRRIEQLKMEDAKKKTEVEIQRGHIRELRQLKSQVQIFLDREARLEYAMQVASAKQKQNEGKCLPSDKDSPSSSEATTSASPSSPEPQATSAQPSTPSEQQIPDAYKHDKVKRKLAHAIVYRQNGDWMSLRSYMHDVVEKAKRMPARTVMERRREDFLGPLFNGGREGKIAFLTMALHGVGLILSPIRGLYEAAWWIHFQWMHLVHEWLPSPVVNLWQSALDVIENDYRYHQSLWLRRLSQGRFFWWHLYTSWVFDTLWEAPVIVYQYLFPALDKNVVLAEAESLRKIIQDIDHDISQAQQTIDTLTTADATDYGKCCRILKDQCISAKFEKYTYKVCPFNKVSQDRTSLGTWKRWESSSTMVFEDGDRCWNGPSRSAHVVLECGAADEIVRVEELATCRYTITLATPAACSQTLLRQLEDALK
ncbi:hypothetical protein LEN26_007242 [Aphanomyces euteiches]|nr:hypothetical protein AeMF1_012054 [Aphanomyces euteiches]KAH9132909.1 hypothetical protein LEN26_007242 [Aphanomyces euteiches]KAH9196612.1 hypothetical protein AeNC1_001425 [Aphanomyces euteiches]